MTDPKDVGKGLTSMDRSVTYLDLLTEQEKIVLRGRYAILAYFTFEHLPETLRVVSEGFCNMAWLCAKTLPHGPETSTALRKLLEAKDCAVRAALAIG